MTDPNFVDAALSTGASIAGGGGLVGIMVRILFNGVSKRLDTIDAHLKDQRKDVAALRTELTARHEAMLERTVKVESQVSAAHKRLDALVTPAPRQRRRKKSKRS